MKALFDLLAGRDVRLDDAGWRGLLAFADRTLSTPLLSPVGPAWFQAEVEARIARIARKQARLRQTYDDAAAALRRAGIEFVLLKGFTQTTDTPRAQNDVDLWVREPEAARRALFTAGFIQHRGGELSYNHGAPLLKPHSWQWRGDYFDPEMPIPVELHYSLWNESRERIAAPGLNEFWDRRVVEGGVPMLETGDRVGFAALHLLRHVLRGNVRPAQAWELARMMERVGPGSMQAHSPEVRRLEAIALSLAASWFDRTPPPWIELPECAREWFARYRMSPLSNLSTPNKDALQLHLALVHRPWDRLVVARRRLLPLRWPRRQEAVDQSYAAFVLARLRYHAIALVRWGTSASSARHTSD